MAEDSKRHSELVKVIGRGLAWEPSWSEHFGEGARALRDLEEQLQAAEKDKATLFKSAQAAWQAHADEEARVEELQEQLETYREALKTIAESELIDSLAHYEATAGWEAAADIARAALNPASVRHGRLGFGMNCICGDPECAQNIQAASERASFQEPDPASEPKEEV